MPRKRKGGAIPPDGRAPKPSGVGKLATRTDLSRPAGTQPVQSPTGLEYGAAKQIQQSQQAMPLPKAGTPGAKPVQAIPKGGFGEQLFAPSARPDEHITAGVTPQGQLDDEDRDELMDWLPLLAQIAPLNPTTQLLYERALNAIRS